MGSWKSFEEIEAYKLARELRKAISGFCRSLPKEETYRLKDQIVRSSRSVTANIAEGFGRHHHQENAQFCRHARGSLTETLDHLNCALDEEYLRPDDYRRLRTMMEETWKVLNGYIAYLQRCANEGVPTQQPNNLTTQQRNNLATDNPTTHPMPPIIQVDHVSKRYHLGQFGAGTLRESVERWMARGSGWLRPRPAERISSTTEQPNNRATQQPSNPATQQPNNSATQQPSNPATESPDELWALRDVSFEVAPGEVLGVIGRNGAGKSTLLKILSRVTEPTSGRVVLRGRVASLLEVGTGFHPELSGRENIFLNGAILGMKKAEIARKFDEIVAFAEVERFIDTPVKRYSSGMYVRLAFAVAAHLEPEILIVDEVLAVGDAAFQKRCLGKMGDVAKAGRTILFVSHNMAAVTRLCTRAIVLRAGRTVFEGGTTEAVDFYLGGGTHAQSGLVELAAAPRQEHSPSRLIRWASSHRVDGSVAAEFLTGDAIVFRIGYAINRQLQAYCQVNFYNTLGDRVMSTRSTHGGPALLLTGEGTIECVLRDVRLVEGDYTVMLEIGREFPHVEWLDCVPEAMRVTIRLGGYLRGCVLQAGQGMIAQQSCWQVLASGTRPGATHG